MPGLHILLWKCEEEGTFVSLNFRILGQTPTVYSLQFTLHGHKFTSSYLHSTPAGNYNRPLASFWCLHCKLWTYFPPRSKVCIVNFEQENVGWHDLSDPEMHSEPCQTSKMELFVKILGGFFPKKFHLKCMTVFRLRFWIFPIKKSLQILKLNFYGM